MWLEIVIGVVALIALVVGLDALFPEREVWDGETRVGTRRRFRFRKPSAKELADEAARKAKHEAIERDLKERLKWRASSGCGRASENGGPPMAD